MRYFFSGIAGAGMNPLAQLMRHWGHEVVGSDRGFDQGKQGELKSRLEAQGIRVVHQDGKGVQRGLERFVYSTAVEQDTPEMRAAKELGVERVPRPQLLAEVVNQAAPGIAVAGTSGKSTVTGMLAWILRQAGMGGRGHSPREKVGSPAEPTMEPSVPDRLGCRATILGGAPLAGEGFSGGFAAGERGGAVVAEACESDGTLVGYRPAFGLVHNISRDHGEIDAVRAQFTAFAAQSATLVANAGCAEAARLAASHPRAVTYGVSGKADVPLEIIAVGPERARGLLLLEGEELIIELPQPGAHNLENAAAAAVLARRLGVSATAIVSALATFPGVARRFEVVGTTDTGIRVVDDYAHNGEKIRAAVSAAQAGCDRLLAIFQPHGYGPARFLRPELKELLPTLLRPQDRFCYSEVFYAGGTVARDISSRELAEDLPPAMRCGYAADHAAVLAWAAETAIPGDTVLLMGARDPDLPRLARAIRDLL